MDNNNLIKRSGALFRISPAINSATIPFIHNWAKSKRLDQDATDLISTLIVCCLDDPERMIDIVTLTSHLNRSRPFILERIKKLTQLGFVVKDSYRAPGKKARGSTRYTLKSLSDISLPPPIPAENQEAFQLIPAEMTLAESNAINFSSPGYHSMFPAGTNFNVKADLLSVFTFSCALPSGKSGKHTEESYKCPVSIGKELIDLEVRPTHGTKVASVLDLRALIALITIIAKRVELNIDNSNPFVINISDIVEIMESGAKDSKRRNSGSFKHYIHASISRWESTGFRIMRSSAGVNDKFNGFWQMEEYFRFITKLKVLSFVGVKGKTPEKIAVTLDDDLLARIKEPTLRFIISAHNQILSEQNPFALRMNIWCRRAIRHETDPESARIWKLSWLHREIEPLRKYRHFLKDFTDFYKDKYIIDGGCAKYLGYIFVFVSKEEVQIYADPNDSLVGDKSYYKYARAITK